MLKETGEKRSRRAKFTNQKYMLTDKFHIDRNPFCFLHRSHEFKEYIGWAKDIPPAIKIIHEDKLSGIWIMAQSIYLWKL